MTFPLYVDIGLFLLMTLMSAFFAMTETAFVSMTLLRAKRIHILKLKGTDALVRLKQKPRKVLATILLWNNMANVTASAIATVIFTNLFGDEGIGLAVGAVTISIMVFGDITPKTFAATHYEKIILLLAPGLELLVKISAIIVTPIEALARLITGVKENKSPLLTESDLDALVAIGVEEGTVGANEARLVRDALDFNDHLVKSVMTPYDEVEYVSDRLKVGTALKQAIASPHYRFPVRDRKNKIIGIVTEKGLLHSTSKGLADAPVTAVMSSPLFVDKDAPISHVFETFQKRHCSIAIVTNSTDKIVGVITLEDILGELIEDLQKVNSHTIVHRRQWG